MTYNYLIAGLSDLKLEGAAPQMDELLELLNEQLKDKDRQLLNILRMRYDNENLLKMIDNKDAQLNPLGTLSRQDWMDLFLLMDETEHPRDHRLQPYVLTFYRQVVTEETTHGILREDLLSTLYYDFARNKKNTFLAAWFTFCLNLNNMLAAHACRRYGWDIKSAIIGNNEVAELLRSQTGREVRLTDEFEEADAVASVAEEPNLLTREHRIDQLKWQWLEDHTEYRVFDIDRVLAYWLQCEIIHRWDGLDVENGRQLFRSMLNDMKRDVKFE